MTHSTMADVSPAELVADALVRWGDPELAPEGVVVGPTTDAQQQGGVITLSAAGLPLMEKYAPLQWMRCQIRCLAGTLDTAENMSQGVYRDLNGRHRLRCRMKSTDSWYLIHLTNVTAGPSMHYDSPETWETLLFAEILLSTDAVGAIGAA